MKLTSFQKSQIRRIVGLHRHLQQENRHRFEDRKRLQEELRKRRKLLDEARAELKQASAPFVGYSAETRERILREGNDRVQAIEGEIAELERELAENDALKAASEAVRRDASNLAEGLIATIDRGVDPNFREEITGLGPTEFTGGIPSGRVTQASGGAA